jgi:hypothetical protein
MDHMFGDIFGLSDGKERLITYNPNDATCSRRAVQVLSSMIEDLKANKLISSKKSSAGVFFETVGQEKGVDVVRDTKTGLTWLPAIEERLNWRDAKDWCENRGLRLPTQDELTLAEIHGIRSIHADFKGRSFWSSSRKGSNAVFFAGNDGSIYYSNTDALYSVRCVM